MISSEFWILIEVASNCLSIGLFVLLLNTKHDIAWAKVDDTLFLGFTTLALTCANHTRMPLFLSLGLLFLGSLGYAWFFKPGSAYNKLFLTTGAQIIYHCCNHLVGASVILFSAVPIWQTLQPSHERLIAMLLYSTLEILLFSVLLNATNHLRLLPRPQLAIFFSLILLFAVISGLLMSIPHSNTVPRNTQHIIAYATLALSALLIAFVWAVDQIAHVFTRNHELQERLALEQHEKDYATAVSEGYETLRRAKHDYHNQLLILQEMLRKEEYRELADHLQMLTGEVAVPFQLSTTGYTAIDAIITAKRLEATRYGVAVDHSALMPTNIEAKATDVAIMLGNIWDNALEAVQYLPSGSRIIFSRMVVQEGELLIMVRNSFDGVLRNSTKGLLSRRDDKRIGTGLHRVEQLAQQHQGSSRYHTEMGEGMHLFVVQILLPIPMNVDLQKELTYVSTSS